MKDRAWIEISHQALINNYQKIDSSIGRSKVMAVVKDQSYGMGLDAAFALQDAGVDFFAVATIDEGIQLRQIGIFQPILIFGYTHPSRFTDLIDFDLIQSIISSKYLLTMNEYGTRHQPLEAHLKVNTGMNRLGIDHTHQTEIKEAYSLPGLHITGIYSHLLSADQPGEGHEKCVQQMNHFNELLNYLDNQGINFGLTHLLNSHGIATFGFSHQYDYVRPGLFLTGTSEFDGYENVLSLLARVASVKEVKAHENVGYGIENKLDRDRKIAAITVGYGDGLSRRLGSLNFNVLVDKIYCPIVGRICMDQMLLDVTDCDVKEGDIVKLIHDDFTPEQMAQLLDTIPNEILTQLTNRLKRMLVYDKN